MVLFAYRRLATEQPFLGLASLAIWTSLSLISDFGAYFWSDLAVWLLCQEFFTQRVQVPNIQGPWSQKPYPQWFWGPESLNIWPSGLETGAPEPWRAPGSWGVLVQTRFRPVVCRQRGTSCCVQRAPGAPPRYCSGQRALQRSAFEGINSFCFQDFHP